MKCINDYDSKMIINVVIKETFDQYDSKMELQKKQLNYSLIKIITKQ